MEWTDLQYFLAVHAKRSVGAAAATLGVNHTTVLRRLARLEQEMGVVLFERLPGGYAITGAGEELAAHLAGLPEQIDAASRQVMGLDLEIRGAIRVTAADTVFSALLMPYLQEFQERHPHVQLQLMMNNAFSNLGKREADIAVRGSNRPPENLIGRRVGMIRTAPYASRAYLARQDAGTAWARHVWITPDESLSHLEQYRWVAANVPADRVRARIDSLVGMVECARRGMGVAMLLCPLADVHEDLVQLAPPLPLLDTQIWILTHPDVKRVARIRALNDFLYERLSIDPRLVHDGGARR
ncbi:MAG TPA: LysR family transcriptional regulator [Noviherbaspirillum sp.]|jgi:DNA-binding transcriptional LysR family regulator|uniref:LysR family transcriptional regulator n=1 Tax=Noviherbaspirillum sp. TaxID=1926288 RepID=UPI002F92C95E